MFKNMLLFLFITLWFSANAQDREATILFDDGTMIEGHAEIKKNKIHFKLEINSEVTIWSHDMVKGLIFTGYGYSEKFLYIKPDKNKDPVLMEVIEEGNVNLYRKTKRDWQSYVLGTTNSGGVIGVGGIGETGGIGINKNGALVFNYDKSGPNGLDVESTYYVKRESEAFATDISFSFKARALRYFKGCKDLIAKINEKEFKPDRMAEMVAFYNEYCGEEAE